MAAGGGAAAEMLVSPDPDGWDASVTGKDGRDDDDSADALSEVPTDKLSVTHTEQVSPSLTNRLPCPTILPH